MIHRPWRLDQDNDQGIVIKDDIGNIVHAIDYGEIPTERGAAFRAHLVQQARANAHAMIDCVNGMAEVRKRVAKVQSPDGYCYVFSSSDAP
jgi:hypothetical protein